MGREPFTWAANLRLEWTWPFSSFSRLQEMRCRVTRERPSVTKMPASRDWPHRSTECWVDIEMRGRAKLEAVWFTHRTLWGVPQDLRQALDRDPESVRSLGL